MTVASNLTITIIGTGIGGTELAGYLGLAGCRVRVHDIRPEAVEDIASRGGLEVEGIETGFAPVELATTDLAAAVKKADLIIIATLSNDHLEVANMLAPLLSYGQAICLTPGYIGGALEFRRVLNDLNNSVEVLVGEMDNFPFTGEIVGPARIRLASLKRLLQVATIPPSDGSKLIDLIHSVFPRVEIAGNVLQTGLSAINPIVHLPGMISNIGRIESGIGFQFYGEGITPSVAQLTEALDAERLAVAQAFGIKVLTLREWMLRSYGLKADSLYDLIQRLHREIFKQSPAPNRFDHRYVIEDVPYGLVPLTELGRLANIPTPVAKALTVIASVALSRDFQSEGRTLERMGLKGLTLQEVCSRTL